MDEPIKILCVDDEKNVLRSIERIFLDSDYEIITAQSGDEGLEIMKGAAPIQVVISDYRMPGMNGVDFLKEVCLLWPDTVRIVLSGYADTAAIVSAINEGQIYKFMPKPWNDDELKVAISNALDRYFIHKKNVQLTIALEVKNQELLKINDKLEHIIGERTADLRMQNRILICSQNILDALPAGVLGIDTDGQIVQCNRKAAEILELSAGDILGMDSKEILPARINTFIDDVVLKGSSSVKISGSGKSISVKGAYMNFPDGQKGSVLVLDEGGENSGNG